jgi:hypothetical protein
MAIAKLDRKDIVIYSTQKIRLTAEIAEIVEKKTVNSLRALRAPR